jgi:hypothetical protein
MQLRLAKKISHFNSPNICRAALYECVKDTGPYENDLYDVNFLLLTRDIEAVTNNTVRV